MAQDENDIFLQQKVKETLKQNSDIDIEELAKEIMKLLKKNLREENERQPR